MSRSQADVRGILDTYVGKRLPDKGNHTNDGQCVALIKNLMAALGVPNPWAARGNAKDVANSYVRDGIATNSDGWLRVCVNPSMGGGYGHVWVDLRGETNYEQNGAKALTCTKGTRPISQAKQIVNLDKWVDFNQTPVNPPTGNRVPQNGTFRASVDRNIRRSPSLNGQIVATFTAGATQKYDSYIDSENFRWVSWIGASGNRNYVAVRRLSDNKCYGECY